MSRFLLILVGIALVGCANPAHDSSTASLKGTYQSSFGDGFKVTGTQFIQYDNADLDVSFAGTIENDPDFTASSGTLIIKITDGGTWAKTVGTYYGARWKGLKEAGVQESSASAYPNATPEPTTLEDALTDFADDSLYTYYGEYARQ